MTRWLLLGSALLAAGCTKQNPAARCSTGTCIDPAYPFCDVDGALSGSAGSCISVSCTPGDFKACRGDVALTCNAMGNNYDELQCQMGCTPEAKGCKLCQAGQTVCANGEVQTCDANGAVMSSEACPLGCFESQPRCRQIDPSNNLAQYADMVPSPPDVTIVKGYIDTGTGNVTDNGAMVAIPSFEVLAPTTGVPLRVFVVNTLTLQDATIRDVEAPNPFITGHAAAFVAKGDITINGSLTVVAGTGAYVEDGGCSGANGTETDQGSYFEAAAGGGGANATTGARGGNITSSTGGVLEKGGLPGAAGGTSTLIPLRGGCPGGTSILAGMTRPDVHGSAGGGAVQLSSGTAIVVNGTIDVRGSVGCADESQGEESTCGGGAGGAALIEAPRVTLGAAGTLLATGGDGGAFCTTTVDGCGVAGHGATSGLAATQGGDARLGNGYADVAGGGGGGLGRIRINTVDQTYTKANTTIEDGDVTVGTIATR